MTAIVTGAGGAIGRAIALRLAAAGAAVAVLDKVGAAAEETVARVRGAGGRAAAAAADISDYAAVAAAVERVERELGPTDVLVNNAGWDKCVPFLESEPGLLDQLVAINLRGPLNVHHVVVRGMVERKRGRV